METNTTNRAINEVFLPATRQAGVGIHFASLPGAYGIGDIADNALAFIETLAKMQIRVWQFLPTGPTAYGDSPYQPLSAFAGNENLIGIEPLLRAGLINADAAKPLLSLPTEFVDYGRLIVLKKGLLAMAAECFNERAEAGLKSAYAAFLHCHNQLWLDDYALYRVLKTKHGERAWTQWEAPYRCRDVAAINRLRATSALEIEQIKIIQFLFYEQWRTLRAVARQHNIQLFADMPIYIALDSADAWAHPQLLRINSSGQPTHVAGVPPDYFSADGQLWGNPLYAWDYHCASGYQWWIERLRHATMMADMVRIDHFRGFEAYWAIPADAKTARHGDWQTGPGDGLFNTLRCALGQLAIVAEDLGVITPEVDALRLRHHIPGMKVLQFAVENPDFQLSDIPAQCVCYTGTHDTNTTIGWLRGDNDDTRSMAESAATRANALRLTRGQAETIHTDMIRLAFSSDARLAIVPMQDYLGLGGEARLNVPSTTDGNWRWRLQSSQLTASFCESVANMVYESSRGGGI